MTPTVGLRRRKGEREVSQHVIRAFKYHPASSSASDRQLSPFQQFQLQPISYQSLSPARHSDVLPIIPIVGLKRGVEERRLHHDVERQ